MVKVLPELNLYDEDWPILTYQAQLPPAKFVFDRKDRRGVAVDSMVSGGCVISGAKIKRSLLFSNVQVHSYARIKDSVSIPVIANGDITSPEKSLEVLRLTNADALMIGRAAQGRPWIFRELLHYRQHGKACAPLAKKELRDIMIGHLKNMHRFYGESTGVRVARKHLTWYCKNIVSADEYRSRVVRVESGEAQIRLTQEYFDRDDGGALLAA